MLCDVPTPVGAKDVASALRRASTSGRTVGRGRRTNRDRNEHASGRQSRPTIEQPSDLGHVVGHAWVGPGAVEAALEPTPALRIGMDRAPVPIPPGAV